MARFRRGSRAARRRSISASRNCAASRNRFKIEYEVVNVGAIAAAAERGAFETDPHAKGKAAPITINQDVLRAVGLVRTLNKPLKVLGDGDLSTPLFVVADAFTASARTKIEGAGGSVTVLEIPDRPREALGVTPTAEEAPAAASESGRTGGRPGEAGAHAPREGRRARTRTRTRSDGRPGRRGGRDRGCCPGRRCGRGRAGRRGRAARDGDPVRRIRLSLRVRIPSQCVPRAGYPAPDPVCPRDPHRLPVPGVRAAAGDRPGPAPVVPREQPDLRTAEPVLGRWPVTAVDRRVGHEPVHQCVDHHAADDGGDPVAPGPQPGR